MIDLNAAYAFVAVVREGSFVGAARILGVPRSTISLRVSRLETAVGERLLRRSTRRVALTDAGQRLFGQLDAAIGTVVAALEPAGDAMKGNVRVTLPPEYPQHIIAQAVARVRARYPEITVELVVTAGSQSNRRLVALSFGTRSHEGSAPPKLRAGAKAGSAETPTIAALPAFAVRDVVTLEKTS